VQVHPQEASLQQAREPQASPAFAEVRRRRQVVEHRIARLVQLGIRQARYFGRTKTLFQVCLAATVANLTLLAATATSFPRGGSDGLSSLWVDSGRLCDRHQPAFGLCSRCQRQPPPNSASSSPRDTTQRRLTWPLHATKSDDFAPYLLKTTDYGQSGTRIVAGIAEDDFTRVIRQDPSRRGLLYAGTETGLYISFDDGGWWQRFQGNLPVSPIRDLAVKASDLIAATHGRSFWILDDVTPLQGWQGAPPDRPHLFKPRPTIRYRTFHGFSLPAAEGKNSRLIGPIHVTSRQQQLPSGGIRDVLLDAGANPQDGVIINYHLHEEAATDVELAFLDARGTPIKTFASRAAPSGDRPLLAKRSGLHRFIWDMRCEDATAVEGVTFWEGGIAGPLVPPGSYQVRLTVGDGVEHQSFEIQQDPGGSASPDDFAAQFDLLVSIRDRLSQTHEAVNLIADLRKQLADWRSRAITRPKLKEAGLAQAGEIDDMLASIDAELIERSPDLVYQHPIKVNAKLAELAVVVGRADSSPPQQSYAVFNELSARVDRHWAAFRHVIDVEVAGLNARLRELEAPLIVVNSVRGSSPPAST